MVDITFKSIDDFDLKGKKVVLRIDINSSIDLEKNEIREDPRIRAALPTFEALKDSAVVVIAHQARPGKPDFTSLELHYLKFKGYLGDRVKYVDDIYGEKAIGAIKALQPGEILILNNIRKVEEENKNGTIEEAEQTPHIKALAPLFDYYINDAFGAAHRSQASLVGWPTLISGPLVKKELEMIEDIEKIALETYKIKEPLIYLKTITRAVLKGLAAEKGKSEISKQVGGGLLGDLSRLAADVAVDATENADLRISRFFPAKALVGEIEVTPGVHQFAIEYYSKKGTLLWVDELGEKEVTKKGLNLFESYYLN